MKLTAESACDEKENRLTMAANHTTARPNPGELRLAAPESRKNWQNMVGTFA
jgi:hypothetical protein